MLKAVLLTALVALALPALAQARPAPVSWCGTDEVTANRVPDLDVSSTAQIRVFYAIPADGADRFAADASGIATDIAWIDEWWRGQDPTRTPRFDRYPFPGCGSTFGALDLGFVRLPQPGSAYAGQSGFNRMLDDLTAATGAGARLKSLVYYDGPDDDPALCGASEENALYGGTWGISIVYLQSQCNPGGPGTDGSADTAAHELIHNLGAVPPGAPHACPDSPDHVCDSTSDILAQYYTPGTNLDAEILDVNHDDYYAHSGSWWDVQDSPWLTHLPQNAFGVTITGAGTVSVTARDGTALPCDQGCADLAVDDGLELTLVPHPAAGWEFSGWSGCPASGVVCTTAVTEPLTAKAVFVRAPVLLRVTIRGKGTVRSAPAGISCPRSCSHLFPAGRKVRLGAKPARGWRLAAWSGACHGTRGCVLPATRDALVRVRFVRR